MESPSNQSERLAINAVWFAKLRWVAMVGQLVTVGFVAGPLEIETPIQPILILIGVTGITNLLFAWWISLRHDRYTARSTWNAVLTALMLLDLIVLTAMLALTGGVTNPFVVFYFVNLALSGVILDAWRAWLLSGLAIICFALLTFYHVPVESLQEPNRLQSLLALQKLEASSPPIVIYGAWIAFAASAMVIVNFITKLTSELRTSDRLRRRAEQQRAKSEKLEALGTLAAGAAHELATPLSTIAVASAEVQRELEQEGHSPEAVDDMRLIREELSRCRKILDRMSTESGQPTAGLPERLTAKTLVEEILSEVNAKERVEVVWQNASEELELVAPKTALAQAVRAVIQNGIDATDEVDPDANVLLQIDQLANSIRLVFSDRGPGMPEEILSRASEPFFTTKPPGRGMGLGLFLARSVIERQGGSLRLESPAVLYGGQNGPQPGTTATIVLPLSS